MILAAVLGLELLRREARVAVAVPDAVGEEASEGNFLNGGATAAAWATFSVTASEHDEV